MSILSKLPSKEQEQDIIKNARESSNGMNNLLLTYDVLVKTTSHKFKRYTSLPVDDLYQESRIGLIKAAESFDPSFNTKFTSWAICCIEGRLRTAMQKEYKHEQTVSLSTFMNSTENNIELQETFSYMPVVYEDHNKPLYKQMDIKRLVTKRELDLIRIRYNLEV